MYCKNCGNKLEEDSAFCNECGAPVVAVDNDSSNAQGPIAQDNVNVQKKIKQPKKKPVKRQRRFPIAPVITVVILVAIAAAGYYGIKYIIDNVPIYYSVGDKYLISIEAISETSEDDENISASGHHISEGLEFCSNGDGTAYVSGLGTCVDTYIVIPSTTPSGDIVTAIGNEAFYGCDGLLGIELSNQVATIGSNAFGGCNNLAIVFLSNSLETISDGAFRDCGSITSLTIPDSVSIIGKLAFYNCYKLDSLVIPYGVTRVGDKTFMNCSSLTSISIPESVTSIGISAFENCQSLTSVVIPNSVTSIGTQAFKTCTSLVSIELSDSVSLGNNTFYGCGSLETINGMNAGQWQVARGY